MSDSKKRFRIALSFAGEKRDFVERVAAILAGRFGEKSILYDKYHEADFGRARLGRYLPKLYHEETDLVVVFICRDYAQKEWPGSEWDAIFDLIKKRKDDEVLLCRFDHAAVEGLFSDAGYVELDQKTPEQAASVILQRLAILERKDRDFYIADQSGGNSGGKDTRIRLMPRWRRACLGILAALIVVPLALLLLKPSETSSFNILIANIDGPPDSQYRVTESLIEDLRKAAKAYPNVKIKALGRVISPQEGSEAARAYGSKEHADVVIWGWFATSRSKIRITIHCEQLGAVAEFWKTSTDQTGVFALSQLENFELQKELGDDLTALALLFVGQSRLKSHDYEGAVEVLSRAVAHLRNKDPLSEAADIYLIRAISYVNTRRIANSRKAIEDSSTAISLRTNFTDAYINRGSAYVGLNMNAEALADCEQALRLVPNHPIALANRSMAFIGLGRFDEAVRDAETACKNVPWFTGYRLCLAQALSAKGEHERAISECDQALKREPQSNVAPVLRANLLRRARRFDEAIGQCTALLNNTNTVIDAYTERARTYWDKGDYQKATDDFGEVLRLNSASAEVRVSRAQMYEILGQHALAIADCDFAIAAKSNLTTTPVQIVYGLRGAAYSQFGNLPAAVTNFSMALQLDPNYLLPRQNRAMALMKQGDFTNALDDLSKLIEWNTNSAEVFFNRGVVCLMLNMYSNAVIDFSRSINLRTDWAEAFYRRGAAYTGLKLYSNAITDLTASINRDPTNLSAYVMRGASYWASGAISEALRDCARLFQATNDAVACQNAASVWSWILEIGQNPAHPENRLALDRQPTPEQKQVHALLIGARGGSLADYEKLRALGEGTNALASLSKTAVEDVVLYFDVYRDRMYLKRSFLDRVRLKPMSVPVDEVIFNELRAPDWTQRATAVSYLAGIHKATTVSHLCGAVLRETNLYVISDITKALNEMTGTRHGPLAVQSVGNWWTANMHEKAYQQSLAAAQRYWNYLTLPPDQAREALGALGQTIAAEPNAHWTRCFRAGCHIVLHEFDLAKEDLAEVEKASPQLSWFLFYRTLLYYAEGKPEQLESLNELLALYPDFEANARQLFGTNVVSDPRIKWPQKQTSTAKSN